MGLYPGSSDRYKGDATTYGPLPTHGFTQVALVLHTTETRGMPSFGNGDTAPHYVYDPIGRLWYVWAEYEDGYVGTMKGHSTGGHGNCQAFQVEILAYSDKALAASSGGIWVGDFSDLHYQDLADFYAWAMDRYGIDYDVTPTPAGGWRYGTSSEHRLTEAEWAAFSGLTAHGAVPLNTHYDTGVLVLEDIAELAAEPTAGPPNLAECEPWQIDAWTKAYECGLLSSDSHPGDVLTKGDYFVFQDRAGFLNECT